jgi:hypothetical protein
MPSGWKGDLLTGGLGGAPGFFAEIAWPNSVAMGGAGLALGVVAPLAIGSGLGIGRRRQSKRLAQAFARVVDVDGIR